MSLKAFHVFFTLMAVMMALGTGGWAFREYSRVGGASNLVMGVLSVAVGLVLVGYFRWFLKKLHHLSYL